MTGQLTRASRLTCGVALIALTVLATGAAATLGAVEAASPAGAAGSAPDPQDGPADDFAGYHGLAEPGTGSAVTARDRAGDRKAAGPRARSASARPTRPTWPGEPAVEDEPDDSAGLVPRRAGIGSFDCPPASGQWALTGPPG